MDAGPSRRLIYWVGQVAVQFAYLEDELDRIISMAEPLMKLPPSLRTWDEFYEQRRFRNRVDYVKSQLLDVCDGLGAMPGVAYHRENIARVLDQCVSVADDRNSVLHSPSMVDPALGPVVQTQPRHNPRRRTHSAVRPVSVSEVEALVRHIATIQNEVRHLDFAVDWLVNATSKAH